MENNNTFDSWAVVELFGHNQIAGKVTEQVIAGQGFVRVDVPAVDGQPGYSRLFGAGAIYSIIPTEEKIVGMFCRRNRQAPIEVWRLALSERSEGETISPGHPDADDEDL